MWRMKVAARISSASRKSSGMRAVGGYLFNCRVAAHVGDAARRRGLRRRDGGELECEATAFAQLAFDANAAAVLFEDFLADGQAQAGAAASLSRHKDAEDFFQIVLFDAAAVIDYFDSGHPLAAAVLS